MSKVKVMQVAAGGYGAQYLRSAIDEMPNDTYEYVGIVDPFVSRSVIYDKILQSGIPLYDRIEDFYAHGTADLVVIAAPIPYHCPYTVYALEHGSNVLCEKPVAATLQDAEKMRRAQEKSGKFVLVGFQWSFARAMLAAKQDYLDGLFGKPVRFRMHVLWQRGWKYFARNNWAGKLKDGRGNWILDSVAHNATAHYLHNEYFMQGDALAKSAQPVSIRCELYRANDIENFDTCALIARMDNGCETLYLTTHAVDSVTPPTFVYEYEKAKLIYNCCGARKENVLYAVFADGTVKEYGPVEFSPIDKLHDALDTLRNGRSITCDVDTATPHLKTINFLADYVPIRDFPAGLIIKDAEKEATYVSGLKETLLACYDKGALPGDLGAAWAQKAPELDMAGYDAFLGRQYE